MNSTISDKEAKSALNEKEREAEEMLNDEHKTKQLLAKAKELLNKIGQLPVISKIVDDVTTTIELIGDSIAGRYEVPKNIIISALAGIIYIVSPIDLIPDFIPIAGWIDDVAVFSLILQIGLSMELSKYRKWREPCKIAYDYENSDVIDVEKSEEVSESPENSDDLISRGVDELKKQMDDDKNIIITFKKIMQNSDEQNESVGMERLSRR